jgi:hypothetical protein
MMPPPATATAIEMHPHTQERRRGPKAYAPITIETLIERAGRNDRRRLSVRDVAQLAGFSAGKVRDDIVIHNMLAADSVPSGSHRRRRRLHIFRIPCKEAVRYLRTLGVIQ